jgi:hypothetical protein
MTSIRACTCSSACRADSACDGLPRFQAHLDAAQDGQHPRIHMKTEACASHLGTMVAAMAAWAREEDLAHADLTILIIEPPPRESYALRQPRRRRAQTSGLVFSIIHLGERENAVADTHPGARHASGRDRQALQTGSENSEFLHLGICGKDLTTA